MDPSTSKPPSRPKPERRRHDQSYKRLFNTTGGGVALVRDLAAMGWADEFDLPAADPFPTETVGPDLRRRLCDCAWRVRFKDGRSAVFLFEFQSSVDPGMVLRTLRYTEAAYTVLHTLERQRDPDGAMPLVLSFVVYTGTRPWTAETTLAGLASRQEPSPVVAQAVAGLATTHGYGLLDLRSALAQGLLPRESVLGWVAALEEDPWTNFPAVHQSMAEQWAGPDYLAERQAFADWTDERLRVAGVPEEARQDIVEQIIQPKEEEEMGQTYAEWAEGHRQRGLEQGLQQGLEQGLEKGLERGLEKGLEQGREQGREQGLERGLERGRAEGRAVLLLRQASRRFGAQTARRLEKRVRSMSAEQLARVGDAVVECDTADDFLAVAGDGDAEGR